ncbi:MAG: SDR family oxidoreductase [Acidobacteria bacterium]|nr:SDR family oxidoreductase [Acidobacteriota bacterium]
MVAHYDDLKGKNVVITGGSSGIGFESVKSFLKQNSLVFAQYNRNRKPLEKLLSKEKKLYIGGYDLSSEESCVELIKEAKKIMGHIDILVHSAGIWNDGAIMSISKETLENIFRVNTFSSYYLARECARIMDKGSIIFVGSTAGERGEPGHSHYAGSKGAVQSLVYSIAQELAPKIRVNIISPGWVRTPMSEEALKIKEAEIIKNIPLNRVAESEDVVNGILFLASDASRHYTGIDLCCSGGALLPMPRG